MQETIRQLLLLKPDNLSLTSAQPFLNQLIVDMEFLGKSSQNPYELADNLLHALSEIPPEMFDELNGQLFDNIEFLNKIHPNPGDKEVRLLVELYMGLETVFVSHVKITCASHIISINTTLENNNITDAIKAFTTLGQFLQKKFPNLKTGSIQKNLDYRFNNIEIPSLTLFAILMEAKIRCYEAIVRNEINIVSNIKDVEMIDALSKGLASYAILLGDNRISEILNQYFAVDEQQIHAASLEIIRMLPSMVKHADTINDDLLKSFPKESPDFSKIIHTEIINYPETKYHYAQIFNFFYSSQQNNQQSIQSNDDLENKALSRKQCICS